MNLPNLITIVRILLIPAFINLLVYGHSHWALGVFAFAALTDSLDGLIARISGQRTELGAYLDPMADKLLLTAAFVTLSFLSIIPVWSTIVVVSRDLILILGTLILHMTGGHPDITPSWLGKSTTVIQLFYVLFALLFMVLQKQVAALFPLLIFVILLTIVSGLHYIYRGIRSLNSGLA
jgi:cardiolipin synthase